MLSINKSSVFITTILILYNCLSAEEISIKDTVNFIKSKMNTTTHINAGGVKYKVIQTFKQIEGCRFSITQEKFGMKKINDKKGESYGDLKDIMYFNAKDLNPQTIYDRYISDGYFFVSTTNEKNVINYQSYIYEPKKPHYCTKKYLDEYMKESKLKQIDNHNCIIESPSSSLKIEYILSPTYKNAPRPKKAFQHLIKMCGGKDELF